MIIPGFIISIFTFPGVIVHELAHQFFCRILKIPVFKVCYFRIGNPCGYVIHESPQSPWASLLVGVGPLFVNTGIGFLVAFPSILGALKFHEAGWIDAFLIWLGFSIAMHSFPSGGDAANIWKSVMASGNSIGVKLVGVPLVGLIWMGAAGSFFWLDAIYGVFIVGFVPDMLVHVLASI